MKSFLLLITLGIFYSSNLFSKDTTSYELKELNVDTLLVSDRELNSFPIEIQSLNDISNDVNFGISNALDNFGGIYIRDYGGLGGMKFANIRGTNSSQNIVLLNGMRINSSQNSTNDFSLIPSSILSKIELVKGGVSSLYGSNGIGGSINLITSKLDDEFSIKNSYGSFNSYNSELYFAKRFGDHSVSFVQSLAHTDGDFQYKDDNEIADQIRSNSDFNQNLSFFQHAYQAKKINFNQIFIFNDTRRGAPGEVLTNNILNDKARLNNQDIIYNNQLRFLNNKNIFTLSSLFKRSWMNYKDPEATYFRENEIYRTYDLDFKIEAENSSELFYNKFKIEYNYDELESNLLDTLNRDFHTISFTYFIEKNFSFGALSSGIRLEQNTLNFNYSPSINYTFDYYFLHSLNISYNFRTPNFNELYFPYYGDEDLKPEKSYSLNYRLVKKLNEYFNFRTDLFYIYTFDLIQAIPRRISIWSVQNLSQASNYGLEFQLDFSSKYFDNKLSTTLQNAFEIARFKFQNFPLLPYTPQLLIDNNSQLKYGTWQLNSSIQFTSLRYPDKSQISELEAFTLWDLALSKSLEIYTQKIKLNINVNNLFNTKYELMNNFPMPGRNYSIALKWSFL